MSIQMRVDRLLARMHEQPQYPTQGAVLLVDLERRETRRAYLPLEVLRTFLGGRGANMFLLYNLLQDGKEALDPEVPLIFGVGPLTGGVCGGTRANATSLSPDSHALLDASAGDYFPVWLKRHGYDHLVLYGRAPEWTVLEIAHDQVTFHDARPYLGLDNLDTCAAIERDFGCTERKDMALARITSAGENLVLSAGIMGGPKAIWARGGGGAKMGSLRLKAVLIQGKLPEPHYPEDPKELNRIVHRSGPVDERHQERAAQDRHAVPLPPEPGAGRPRHQEQPGDDLGRCARRRQLRRVPARHGRLLQVRGALPRR